MSHRVAGIVAVGLAVSGCSSWVVGVEESTAPSLEFDAVWSWVDSLYPALAAKSIDWNRVYAELKPRAEAARGDEIVPILVDLLALLEDGHVYYQTPGGGVVYPTLMPRFVRDRYAFDPGVVRSVLDMDLAVSADDVFDYGVDAEGIGYLRIATFDRDGMDEALAVAMDGLGESVALVLDIRNNNGGKAANVAMVMSRFIRAPMRWMDAFEQDGVPFEPWPPIEPDDRAAPYDDPVILLINGATMSAGELFAELLKQMPNVTAVGDTTAGSACNDYHETPGDLRLESGRLVHVPTACVARYDGQLIEWNGITPDVRISQTSSDVRQGRDPQLEVALELAGRALPLETAGTQPVEPRMPREGS